MSKFFNKTRMKETEKAFKGKTNKELRLEKKYAKEMAMSLMASASHELGRYHCSARLLKARGLKK